MTRNSDNAISVRWTNHDYSVPVSSIEEGKARIVKACMDGTVEMGGLVLLGWSVFGGWTDYR